MAKKIVAKHAGLTRGRPKTREEGAAISVHLSLELKEMLDELSDLTLTTRSELIRRSLHATLPRYIAAEHRKKKKG